MRRRDVLKSGFAGAVAHQLSLSRVRLIISDLDNQSGVLGWHTTSATVSAASTQAFAL
jgi:hypothetical protein